MKKKFVIFSILFLMFPFLTKAATLTSSVVCSPTSVVEGNTVTCDVTITNTLDSEETESTMRTFSANINSSVANDFQLVSITPATNWNSKSSTNIDFENNTYGDEEGQETGFVGTLKIATLKFKVKVGATSDNKTIELSGGSLTSSVTSNTIRILSTNNTLNSLTIAGQSFYFSQNQKSYQITTNQSSIVVNATKTDAKANFKSGYGPRTVNLNYGVNNIQIIVVSENGNSNVYTLVVTRTDERSNNNYLSSISLSTGKLEPIFNKADLNYDVLVPSGVSSIEIMADKEHPSAKFAENSGPRTVALKKGLNIFYIKVISEKGETRTYTLNIKRSDDSSNNYLKSITLTNGQIQFDKNVLEYNVNVLYDILEMEVSGEVEDPTAKVEVFGTKSLIVGTNTYKINVTAQNESIRTYVIKVTRLQSGKTLSSNNNLKGLVVGGYDLNFSKEVLEYDLKIKKEKALSISYTVEDETSVVKIIGNKDLENGSKIKIVVTSEDGKSKIYQISVLKDKNYLTLALYIAGGIIIGLGTLLLVFKNKIFKKKGLDQIVSEDSVPTLKGQKLVLNQNTQIFARPKEIVPIPEDIEPTTFEEK